jgi:hypothetical protein
MDIGAGDNVLVEVESQEVLGEVEQLIPSPIIIAIVCYEGPDGEKRQIRKPVDSLEKPLNRQDEDPCPSVLQ